MSEELTLDEYLEDSIQYFSADHMIQQHRKWIAELARLRAESAEVEAWRAVRVALEQIGNERNPITVFRTIDAQIARLDQLKEGKKSGP